MSKKRYDKYKFKQDVLGSLTAVGWIFPLALAFGSNSPFGTAAGIVGAIVACVLGAGNSKKVPMPHVEVFAVLFCAANAIGVSGAMLSCIIAGAILLFVATLQFNKSFFVIPPEALGAITFIVAAVLCITQVNYYFGIGVPVGNALDTLMAYRSFGFHANWRGVLYGTITLVVMITYPIKFKKLSKRVPAPAVALVGTTLLNLMLNPSAQTTAIDEVGDFVSSAMYVFVGKISIYDVTHSKFIPALFFAWALVVVLVADTLLHEERLSAIHYSLAFKGLRALACPLCEGMTVSDDDSYGETRLTGVFAAVIMILISVFGKPLITRVPIATLAVIIICTAWQRVRFRFIQKSLSKGKKVIRFAVFIVMVVLGIFWNLVAVIDITSFAVLGYCFHARAKKRRSMENGI